MNRKGKWYNRLAAPVAKSIERPKQDEYHGEETFKMCKLITAHHHVVLVMSDMKSLCKKATRFNKRERTNSRQVTRKFTKQIGRYQS